MADLLICRNTEGRTVAEVDLDETILPVEEIVDRALQEGAELVWAHGGSPTIEGFVAMPGYVHLHAEQPVPGERLPSVATDVYGPLLAQAFLGQWGHKWVDPTQPLPTDGSTVLGLYENDTPIGLCRVWPEERLIDHPGVIPERRATQHILRLLGAACALLGPGPVDVDSWGQSPEVLQASRPLGFRVTDQKQGWELRL
jgi:hypothetical protein